MEKSPFLDAVFTQFGGFEEGQDLLNAPISPSLLETRRERH
jgi:hypothetical protein